MYGITYMVTCIIMRWRRTQILTQVVAKSPSTDNAMLVNSSKV